MPIRILTRAKFLELCPSDRLTFLETAQREIDEEIARLKRPDVQIRDGRPRSYHLKLLHIRRRRLAKLAQEAGYADMMDVA